jgi:hypothetical protein
MCLQVRWVEAVLTLSVRCTQHHIANEFLNQKRTVKEIMKTSNKNQIAILGQASACTLGVSTKYVERWSPNNNEWL